MTLDQINLQLSNLANSGDPYFSAAATQVAEFTRQTQKGEMSPEELTETLNDLKLQLEIINDASKLAFKETLNTCVNGIITLVGIVG